MTHPSIQMADMMFAAVTGADPRQPSTWTPTQIADSERREQALNDAYAAGRKDEREDLEPAVEALEYLFLAIVTHADSDYRFRAVKRAEEALMKVMPGWTSPVPPLPMTGLLGAGATTSA
jgi:hypothetical protein